MSQWKLKFVTIHTVYTFHLRMTVYRPRINHMSCVYTNTLSLLSVLTILNSIQLSILIQCGDSYKVNG